MIHPGVVAQWLPLLVGVTLILLWGVVRLVATLVEWVHKFKVEEYYDPSYNLEYAKQYVEMKKSQDALNRRAKLGESETNPSNPHNP